MIELKDLLELKPLMFDGGLGTEIHKKNLPEGTSVELINIVQPESLFEIHKDYVNAGSRVISSNTFGANRKRLEISNNQHLIKELNFSGIQIARNAAEGKAFVAGSIGSLGVPLEPFGDLSLIEAKSSYMEQVTLLKEADADFILIETMMSLDEGKIAIEASLEAGFKTVGITFTYDINGLDIMTSFGESLEFVVSEIEHTGVSFIGSNCGNGMNNMYNIAKTLKSLTSLPLLIQPNAGLPEYENGKIRYNESADMFADFVLKCRDLGIQFIGGCCGTTPDYIKKAYEALNMVKV